MFTLSIAISPDEERFGVTCLLFDVVRNGCLVLQYLSEAARLK